ncbi:MAG: flagellar hook-associated protein FlgK [Planctomycetales bacterium]|nr:flagellar hook-associated protein FlgK [bacterium]UNM09086.1 MAG: flagellar hook-associated protein FlgK [Planctomycetales bacterium]
MLRGTFLGLETSKKGLLTARAALDVTGHNIANANTEGYSRQRVNISASDPLSFPGAFVTIRPGQVGTGATVTSITRIRSIFIESQLHQENGRSTLYQTMSDAYIRVEDIFNEPSENGLNSLMDNFFNAWEDLSNDPESASTRTNLAQAGLAMTEFVNEQDRRLDREVMNINEQLQDRVDRLNQLNSQIAVINKQIIQIESGGDNGQMKANDLMDQRDRMIEEVSNIINARVQFNNDGSVSVLVQGHPMVSGVDFHEIRLQQNQQDLTRPYIEFSKSRIRLDIRSGELGGMLQMRDVELPTVRLEQEKLVTAFTNRVNKLHIAGYGLDGLQGRSFFTDYRTEQYGGSTALPAGTTLDTTLDQLGFTSGDFFIQGQRIEITPGEVLASTAITLGDLFQRIEQATQDVRVSIDGSLGFDRVVFEQYNPVDADTTLKIKDGSSNFFEQLGLDNATHQTFFLDPPYRNSLANFGLNPQVLSDLDSIAAAGDDGTGFPGPGDNRTALAIADLRNDNKALLNSSFGEYYQGLVSSIGATALTAQRSHTTQTLVVEQLVERRLEISGVNLDEEAVNIVKYQSAYEANARALNVVDEVLDLIVNRLGTVGR